MDISDLNKFPEYPPKKGIAGKNAGKTKKLQRKPSAPVRPAEQYLKSTIKKILPTVYIPRAIKPPLNKCLLFIVLFYRTSKFHYMFNKSTGISHLVVVPREHFHQVSSNYSSEIQISDRGMGTVSNIR